MATMHTTFTASGTFTLTDENGVVVFTYSPSFTSTSNTTAHALYTGEHLAQTGASELALADVNDDRVYVFIKNVDTDYPVAVKPDGDVIADLKPTEFMFAPVHIDGAADASTNLDVDATTAAQKVQFLLCDGPNTGINSDD